MVFGRDPILTSEPIHPVPGSEESQTPVVGRDGHTTWRKRRDACLSGQAIKKGLSSRAKDLKTQREKQEAFQTLVTHEITGLNIKFQELSKLREEIQELTEIMKKVHDKLEENQFLTQNQYFQ